MEGGLGDKDFLVYDIIAGAGENTPFTCPESIIGSL
jgi:hypothetical protein